MQRVGYGSAPRRAQSREKRRDPKNVNLGDVLRR